METPPRQPGSGVRPGLEQNRTEQNRRSKPRLLAGYPDPLLSLLPVETVIRFGNISEDILVVRGKDSMEYVIRLAMIICRRFVKGRYYMMEIMVKIL